MNRRILFATTDYSVFTAPVKEAFNKLGYKVKLFDYYKPNFTSRILGFASNTFLQKHDIKKHLNHICNTVLIHTCQQFKPKYLLVIKGETINSNTIQKINQLGITTINWYSDWHVSWPWIKKNAPSYSFFINTCETTYKKLKQLGCPCHYLPFATTIKKPLAESKKIYNLSFVGQHTSVREKYFQSVKDLGLHIWGYKKWQSSSLKRNFHGPVSAQASLDITRKSKICVNILTQTKNLDSNGINVRTYQAPGMGTLLLVKYKPILKTVFKPKKEIIAFSSAADLRQKAKYYLTHQKNRRKIAFAGHKRAKLDHTYIKRMKQMLNIITSI